MAQQQQTSQAGMNSPFTYFQRRDAFQSMMRSSQTEFILTFQNVSMPVTGIPNGDNPMDCPDVKSACDAGQKPEDMVFYFFKEFDAEKWYQQLNEKTKNEFFKKKYQKFIDEYGKNFQTSGSVPCFIPVNLPLIPVPYNLLCALPIPGHQFEQKVRQPQGRYIRISKIRRQT